MRAAYTANDPDKTIIGIAWHSANPTAAAQKSTSLLEWGPLLQTPGAIFVSLQYGNHAAEVRAAEAAFGCRIVTDKTVDSLKDIDAFAAQVAAMDHVVSVSNTTVHVAGGLGVPTSVLLPKAFGKIWYWFLERSDSPWYPSLTLHRQTRAGAWNDIIAAAARTLT